MLIIDRFENNTAVCEIGEGEFIRIPCENLPADVKEGCVLIEESGSYRIDIKETERRMQKSRKKLENIFKTLDFFHRDSYLKTK